MSDSSNDVPSLGRRDFAKLLGAAALGGALPVATREPSSSAVPEGESMTPLSIRDELCDLTAIELASRIRRKEVSAREVVNAHLARIAAVNPKINAIVTLVADRAIAEAIV